MTPVRRVLCKLLSMLTRLLMPLLMSLMAAGPVLAQTPAQTQTQTQETSVTVEGQRFAQRATVFGSALVLNGTGVRAVAWFKGYAAALYLRERASSAQQVLATSGPKRVQLRMLQDVPTAEMAKAVRNGVQRNAPDADKPQMAPALAALDAQILALPKVRKGDVIDLDYDGLGELLLSVNGAPRGPAVAGKTLYPALLLAFVGDHPYDKALRAGLLGQSR